MPTIPSIQTLQATTPNILNAIRKDLGGTYAELVPLANDTNESIKKIGSIIMQNTPLQNSFLNSLVNRIGMTIVTSKTYTNPWKMFKKGFLDFGESVEEIFVAMANPVQYESDSENAVFKKTMPDVSTAFHRMNFAKRYDATVYKHQLKQAFLSMSGVTDLISKIIESLYTGMEYDEFIMMKFLLAKVALSGKITPIAIPSVTKANLEDIVTIIKTTSQNLTYMSKDYNMSHVKTLSPITDQYNILTSSFEAGTDVSVLAKAFQMDKVEFMGHRVPVDGFDKVDTERLAILFKDDASYVPFAESELTKLKDLPAMLLDKDFFMIFDNLQDMSDIYNPKDMYWNYFLNVWKTFSVSPFANGVLFTTATPSVTSVTVSPSTASVQKGSIFMMSASVVVSGFADDEVIWSVDSEKSVVTPDGILTVAKDETKTTLTVTATSVFDKTKTSTATITVL